MNYQETLKYLYSQLPMYQRIGAAAYKENLDNTIALDNKLGNPHKKFKTIHIAGTNGKGTISHSLASVLQQAGYKVGLYTSPHLLDFRERIRINGQKISESFVVDFVAQNKYFFEQLKPSFFEMTVGLAFDYFAKQDVDVAVVEVGMGGRLDSTNIINPIACVITNIGYDHQQFLGNDLVSIAKEKAGIIKNNVPVVVGETKPNIKTVFTEKAEQTDSQLFFANHNFSVENFYINEQNQLVLDINKHLSTVYNNLIFDFAGYYQLSNIITILQTIEILQYFLDISEQNIFDGLKNVTKNTGIMGRWQVVSQNPQIICDVGHNIDGITAIVNQLKLMNFNNLHFIFGVVNDKDISGILKLLPKEAHYYFTQASVTRALPVEQLYRQANLHSLNGDKYNDVKSAIDDAKNNCSKNDLIFIGGSTFVVADALEVLL